MNRVGDFFKDLFLDVFAVIKGFSYGFLVVGLAIVLVGALIFVGASVF
ncbi:hypothetical protein FLK61_23980 [Paenalkalicoccus suaedae]|uniref:Uncharacterized protein n=1 Tax=Paenalkalicoccus suaedae TaxID=2592382 RepID=A0A859F9Q5_9BACI|nr:hypothetical protein [Paenalkalicoccus suaedae]QKS69849.1 hypothetical protein FLK61_23980 [Paenalkalicoccus suaedae]